MQTQANSDQVSDAEKGNWVDRFAPGPAKPYLRLARLDRPIGIWLLFWPCAASVMLAAIARPAVAINYNAILLFLIGAVAMRGAGCTFNDIVDKGIDRKVARTAARPVASGKISLTAAILFMAAQSLIGLLVLIQFNWFTIQLGIASLVLVAIYPFMKRITWWPQLFLGLAFSWGALIGWASQFGMLHAPAFILYAGCILWTIGYDTIYALLDIEDDELIGVKSTARLFGTRSRLMVGLFFLGAFLCWVWAGWSASAGTRFLYAIPLPALLMIWQVATLKPADTANCLRRFRASNFVGLALTIALFVGTGK